MMPRALLLLLSFVQQEPDPLREAARLQEAIRTNPAVENSYTDLGNLLLRTQNFPQAAAVLEAARIRFPASAQVILSLGVAYYGQRKFADAVAAFIETARLAPDIEQPVAFLSRLSEHWADRKPEVDAMFNAYARRNPASALGQYALGKARADAVLLRRAVELNPRLEEAHYELGLVLEAQRNYPEAIACYRKAVQLAPRNPLPHYRLARLYARAGDKARADRERALHEALAADEKAEIERRQAATRHLSFGEKK